MSGQNPYPDLHAPGPATVSYSLREIIDQINRKLDILPGLANQINAQETRAVEDRAALRSLESRVHSLESQSERTAGGLLTKDRLWARLVGIAGVFGAVAGGVAAIMMLILG